MRKATITSNENHNFIVELSNGYEIAFSINQIQKDMIVWVTDSKGDLVEEFAEDYFTVNQAKKRRTELKNELIAEYIKKSA